MQALIHARVSQDTSGRERSVDEQVEEARAWCAREGWAIVHVIREVGGISRHSNRTTRDELTETLDWIRSGKIQVLITWELSRAARDLATFALLRDACREHGVQWGYGGQLRDFGMRSSNFRAGWDALLSEHETDRTSDRVRRAMQSNALAGRPHGKHLWGYTRAYDQTTKRLLTVHIDQNIAALIREAADRYLTGDSLYAIAVDWNARQVPTRRPRVKPAAIREGWTGSAIRQVLTNPAYAGIRVHHGDETEASWPAILDRHAWDRIRSRLNSASPDAGGVRKTFEAKHLLSGVARCGIGGCGAPLVAGKNTTRVRRHGRYVTSKYPSYVCASRQHLTINAVHAEAIVVESVLTRIEQTDFMGRLALIDGPDDERRHSLLAAIAADEAWLSEVRQRADSLGSAEVYYGAEEIILPKVVAARRELAALSPADPNVFALADAADVRRAWEQLPVRGRRDIIRSLAVVTIMPALRVGLRGIEQAIARTRIEWKAS